MNLLRSSDPPKPIPISGNEYLIKLHRYLHSNFTRLAPSPSQPSIWQKTTQSVIQQSYTLLTLGLDPSSAPLSRGLKVPLTLGFGGGSSSSSTGTSGISGNSGSPDSNSRSRRSQIFDIPPDSANNKPTNTRTVLNGTGRYEASPSLKYSTSKNDVKTNPSTKVTSVKPLLLRLPPDRLLYLLLRWQSLSQSLPHVGQTDVPLPPNVGVSARGSGSESGNGDRVEGDVNSVRSWVGSMRSMSLGSGVGSSGGERGWWGRKEIKEDDILLDIYSAFTVLPGLLIHPPYTSEPPITELIEAGGYTQLGGIDVRVPLDVMRNLQLLELEGYDPRALLIPLNPHLRSLTVRDVQDGDEWVEELLRIPPPVSSSKTTSPSSSTSQTNPSSISQQHAPSNETSTPWSQNDLPSQPSSQARFPNLRHLSLSSTCLLSFPFVPLTKLTHLDLSHNLLNTLPPSLSALSSLTSLNLSNNLITSVRSAASTLGAITSLNLSGNRIDCLAGLERILALERVDLRNNSLSDFLEIGRLAVLPMIKEIWCSPNPFSHSFTSTSSGVSLPLLPGLSRVGDGGSGMDWRIELGVCFLQEGKEVILDDTPFSWLEQRNMSSLLALRGKPSKIMEYKTPTSTPRRERLGRDGNGNNTYGRTSSPITSLRVEEIRKNGETSTSIMEGGEGVKDDNNIGQSHLGLIGDSGKATEEGKVVRNDIMRSPVGTSSKKKKPMRRVIKLDEQSIEQRLENGS
ncbi:hypothetical protein M231_02801 [Tremella mesenterica]|uniref:Uncharacterized protein n=1 Tax=Tremella mesenterica TaxID=5217 RepID=A0A4V1M4C3_TREME|nr:hypothetical protein M231_02801 [Tremella mesenterica]